MIELKNAAVVKNGKTLFKDFNFTVQKGEHWVVQGRNGTGKTTLLQLLAGTITPTSGYVTHSFVTGNDWDTRYRQRQEKIHFIPTHWIQAFLSGLGDVFYQQRYYSVEDIQIPRVSDVFGEDMEALQRIAFSNNFDIHQLLDLHITRLSNGQLKKVIILRQLVKNIPELLILDYPFDGLDADSRKDLSNFIDDIATRFKIQIILTDHGYTLPSVVNRRLVLNDFAIEKIDIPERKPSGQPVSPHSTENVKANGQPVVEMQDVTIAYGGKKVIENLNWRINKGERWALTGKNGSGKTTLFSLIYADHPMAYSQKVFLFGKRRGSGESIWDIKNRINYMGPEQIHFLDEQTRTFSGRQYIAQYNNKKNDHLNDLINFFDAAPYIDLPVRHLSSGQLQMLLLIRFFLDDKELLLLDEPFQFLDPLNHEKVTTYLNHFLDENVTLVLITHDEKDVSRWTQLRKVIG